MVVSPVTLALMQLVTADEALRVQRIREAWAAYHGWPGLQLGAPAHNAAPGANPIKRFWPLLPSKTDPEGRDNTLIPYARLIVNTVVAWLYGQEPQFNLDDTRGRNASEQWLDQVWQANRKAVTLTKHGLGSAVAGHGFLKLQQSSALTGDLPRVIVLDPENVSVVWDEEDVDVVKGYTISWPCADMGNGRPGRRCQRITPNGAEWLITDETTDADGGQATKTEERWPYPFPPIMDAQHLIAPAGCYYGLSEIDSAVQALNHQVSFGVSNANRVTRVWGSPKMWARGIGSGDIDVSPDSLTLLPGDQSELRVLEMQGDVAAAYGHIDRLIEQMLMTSRIPLLAVGEVKSIGKDLSGTALQILFRPLLQHIEQLRLTQGVLLQRLNGALLALGGKGARDGTTPVTVQWPELLPGDLLEERQVALLDEQLGVASKATLADKLGYDYDREREMMDAEQQAEQEAQQQALDRGTLPGIGAGMGRVPPLGGSR